MKVLLVSPYYMDSYKNGLSMGSAVKLATNLSEKTKVVVLTSGRKIEEERVSNNLRIISAKGFLIPDPVNYMISFDLLVRFVALVKSFKPQVVIVSKYMFFSSLVIPLARVLRIPVITVTDTFPGINWFSVSRLASVIMWVYARVLGLPLLWWSNKVVLLYRGLEPIAKKYRLNYVMIPNGVESKYLGKLPRPDDLKKPKDQFWVGFVGRPESAKGYVQALSMADDLQKYESIRFVFAGGGANPRVDGNKVFLGFRRDMMNIYQTFDVLILPSHAEGLPNVVMEAMAQGVSVIANTVGGVSEIIKDRRNGFLVTPGDKKEMEKRVVELHKNRNLRMKLGVAARETIKNDFNWSKILEDYKKLIEQVCAV